MSDINSFLPVTDAADGTAGSAAPTTAIAVAGSDGTNLRILSTDSTGKVNINNVSGTVSLPTGASTSTLQTTGNTSLSSIDTKTPALGQALAAASVPIVLTAAQLTTLTPLSTVAVTQSGTWNLNNISGTVSLPTGAATAANQTNATQKTQIVDGSGNVIASTSNALNVTTSVSGVAIDPRQGVVERTSLPSAAANGTYAIPLADPYGNAIKISETSAFSRFGQMFMVTTGATSTGLATERPYLYFKNSSGNTKSARIKKFVFSSPSSGNTVYKMYKNPTVTVNGSALTITGARQTGQASAQSTCFLEPTVTSDGTLFKAFNVPTGGTLVIDMDYQMWIEPNNSILITSTQSLIGGFSGVDVDFIEE